VSAASEPCRPLPASSKKTKNNNEKPYKFEKQQAAVDFQGIPESTSPFITDIIVILQ
jgi:hypothetical protein